MRSHIDIIALVHGAFACLQLVTAGVVGLLFLFAVLGVGFAAAAGGDDELLIIGGVYSVVGVFAVVFALLMCIPGFAVAWGLKTRKPWARILGMIVSALIAVNFPLGTLLGVYSLYVLLDAEVAAEFAGT